MTAAVIVMKPRLSFASDWEVGIWKRKGNPRLLMTLKHCITKSALYAFYITWVIFVISKSKDTKNGIILVILRQSKRRQFGLSAVSRVTDSVGCAISQVLLPSQQISKTQKVGQIAAQKSQTLTISSSHPTGLTSCQTRRERERERESFRIRGGREGAGLRFGQI